MGMAWERVMGLKYKRDIIKQCVKPGGTESKKSQREKDKCIWVVCVHVCARWSHAALQNWLLLMLKSTDPDTA